MANYCCNWASINGPQESLDLLEKRIEEALKDGDSLWAKTYPILFGKTDMPDDVYDEYGSKWFDIVFDRHGERDATISGDSAWSPVSPLMLKLSKEYNLHIDLQYEEPGCDFGGFYECKNGEVLRDDEYEYNEFMMLSGNQEQVFSDMKYNIEDGLYDSFNEFCTDHVKVMKKLSDEDVAYFKSLFEKYKKNENN